MDFFKSVFTADPEPSDPRSGDEEPDSPPIPDPTPSGTGIWAFGGLMKTIASKSEAVIQTYRRDLEEFGTGLRKETAALSEAAARAVRDLPGSLEAGASAAQESLESVGRVVDDIGETVWRGTAEIITQGKDAILAMDSDADSDASAQQGSAAHSKRYSRFDMLVLALQGDQNTFLEAPDDAQDFATWRNGFELDEKEDEIDELCRENEGLEGMFGKLVPKAIDYDTFWSRYFYKVHKLKQAEDARAELVKRVVISTEEEEDLSWEVDDDDDNDDDGKVKQLVKDDQQVEEKNQLGKEDNDGATNESGGGTSESAHVEADKEKPEEESKAVILQPDERIELERKVESVSPKATESPMLDGEDATETSGAKMVAEEKVEPFEPVISSKDSDFSMVSSHPSMAEVEDLGWDEIEDIGEHDEKKTATSGGSPTNKIDFRKRLSVAEDDEDLSWDIEDD